MSQHTLVVYVDWSDTRSRQMYDQLPNDKLHDVTLTYV